MERAEANGPAEQIGLQNSDPKIFVLERELAEVHLLIENLSANPDKSLGIKPEPEDQLPPDWIKKICLLHWPPEGTRDQLAEDAALLIKAKDFLNRQAKPASGATIAFTLLVAEGKRWFGQKQPGGKSSRSALAELAYPGLAWPAFWFRCSMWSLCITLFVTLFATCWLSWYVAYGASILSQRAIVQSDLTAAEKRVNDAEAGVAKTDSPPDGQGGGAQIASSSHQPPTPFTIRFCDRSRVLPPIKIGDSDSVQQFYSPADIQICETYYKADFNAQKLDGVILGWIGDMEWVFNLKGWFVDPYPGKNLSIAAVASSVLSILGGSVLPVFYGILGAAAAVLRSISRKFLENRLTPRDFMLSLQQLALGAVTGSCISLFVAQPSPGVPPSAGLISSVALTSSALSFVAGFGVEQVFGTLEMIIRRVFPGAGNAADGKTSGLPSRK